MCMFRNALVMIVLCIGFRADAQVIWDSLLQETNCLDREGEFSAMLATSLYSDSLLQLAEEPDSFFLCIFRHKAGTALHNMGRYEEAIAAFDRAIAACYDAPEGRNQRGIALYDRAFAEYALRRYRQSYQTVIEAEAALAPLENPDYDYLLSVYADLCFQATEMGNLTEAEKYLQKGELLYQQIKDKITEPDDGSSSKEVLFEYNYIALYAESGDEKKMLEHLSLMKQLRAQKKFNGREEYMYAVGLNHVADFYLNFHERWENAFPFEQAERFQDEAFAALDKGRYPSNYVQFTFNRSKALRKLKKNQQALKGNDYLLSIADSTDPRMPFFLAQRGLIFASAGQKEQAIQTFESMARHIHTGVEPLQADFANFAPSSTINHTDLLAGVMDEFQELFPDDEAVRRQAAAFYPLALRQFVYSLPFSSLNFKLREYYEKCLAGILASREIESGRKGISLPDLLTQIEQIENRLAWQEHLLNRNFNELKIPDSLLYQEMDLRFKIAEAKQKKASELTIFEWEEKLAKFERNLRQQYPAHADFVNHTFDLKALQARLGPQSLILRYKKAQDDFYLFAISASDIQLFEIGKKNKIEPYVSFFLNQTASLGRSRAGYRELYPMLLPMKLSLFQQLIIIPDDMLYDVPFELLMDSSQYLIESHTISYSTHLVFVHNQLNKNQEGGSGFMAFAPDYEASSSSMATRSQAYRLRGAKEEAHAICRLFQGHVYDGQYASKAQFMQAAPAAKILHLAMHADIHNEQPELSYLLFLSDSILEKMYVEELYGMNLRADLAVLSACNTGKGAPDERRGMVSLHRAFCYAGVPATVASLWTVPDQATQQIMRAFYTHLRRGLSKAKALQQAKLDYLAQTQDPHLQHPFFWAGFVLYGDAAPIASSLGGLTFLFWTGMSSLLILLILGLISFRM